MMKNAGGILSVAQVRCRMSAVAKGETFWRHLSDIIKERL